MTDDEIIDYDAMKRDYYLDLVGFYNGLAEESHKSEIINAFIKQLTEQDPHILTLEEWINRPLGFKVEYAEKHIGPNRAQRRAERKRSKR